ncbi:MAG: hypothetical protein K8F92_16365 [Hyphomicrobium sp.]|uniref:hypothetical protein n=1 Tax=Hyphomicrobium sp. TaxID=82 RepID=UPI0025C600FD|nr:hypothetical protein [Hyphomicrobium sp.]MBZ0211206.1 hypothetical protein [Hyphomicrobium sp.]
MRPLSDAQRCEQAKRLAKSVGRARAASMIDQARRNKIRRYLSHRQHRPPGVRGEAGRIVFAHDPDLHATFEAIAGDAEKLLAKGLKSQSGGREGMIVSLEIACRLIERLPLAPNAMSSLLEAITAVQDGLQLLRTGESIRAFSHGPRPPKRPRNDARKREFRIRCVLLVVVLTALNAKDAVGRVHQKGKQAAGFLGYDDFTRTKVHNWFRRHTTAWNAWCKSGCHVDDHTPEEVIRRQHIELLQKIGDICGSSNLRAYKDVLMASIDLANVDRPLDVLARRGHQHAH